MSFAAYAALVSAGNPSHAFYRQLQESLRANRELTFGPNLAKQLQALLKANRELYSTPNMAKQIQETLRANRELFSAPNIAEQVQETLRANRELIQRAVVTGAVVPDVGTLDFPDVDDDSQRTAQWLLGLSTTGRLIVLNAMLGLLQALLFQIESTGTEISNSLQAGIGSTMAIIAAIIAIENRAS